MSQQFGPNRLKEFLFLLLLPLSAALLLLFALSPFIFAPFMLIAHISARLFLQNFRSAATGSTSVIAALKGKPFNLSFFFICDGILEFSDLKNSVTKTLLKEDPHGNKIYARFQEFATSFMGYTFFVRESDFKLEDHFKLIAAPKNFQCTPEDVKKYAKSKTVEKLIHKTWPKDKSPWEIELTHFHHENDPSKSKTVGSLTTHHYLGDGYALTHFVQEIASHNKPLVPDFDTSRFTKFQKFQFYFLWILYVPWDFLKIVSTLSRGFSKSGNKSDDKKLADEFQLSLGQFVPEEIKCLKNTLGVKYDTVLYSAAGASIFRLLKEGGKECPEFLTMAAPLPKPDHPKTPTNNFYTGFISLPISCKSMEERLEKTEACYTSGRSNSNVLFMDRVYIYAGYLFPAFISRTVYNCFAHWVPTISTSFPPLEEFEMMGHRITYGSGAAGPPAYSSEMVMTFVGKKPKVKPMFLIRHDFLPPYLSVKCGQYFKEEIQRLKTYSAKLESK